MYIGHFGQHAAVTTDANELIFNEKFLLNVSGRVRNM
jgi:hypothetical protein